MAVGLGAGAGGVADTELPPLAFPRGWRRASGALFEHVMSVATGAPALLRRSRLEVAAICGTLRGTVGRKPVICGLPDLAGQRCPAASRRVPTPCASKLRLPRFS